MDELNQLLAITYSRTIWGTTYEKKTFICGLSISSSYWESFYFLRYYTYLHKFYNYIDTFNEC